jgi:hypothetical protein
MNSQFNAIDYSQQLQAAGVSQAQAEVHARTMSHALRGCTASRADLEALDAKLSARIDAFEERIMLKIDTFEIRMEAFETRIGAKVAACEANVKLELAKIREAMAEMRGDLKFNRWMSGITLAMVFAMFAKLFMP